MRALHRDAISAEWCKDLEIGEDPLTTDTRECELKIGIDFLVMPSKR